MTFELIAKLVATVGLPTGLVIFFVWHYTKESVRREDKLSKRINEVEDYNTKTMSKVISDNTAANKTLAESSKTNTQVLESLTREVSTLACQREPWDGEDRRRQRP